MYWPKFSERKLLAILKRRRPKIGCAANYIQWTTKTGLKLFPKKRIRDAAYSTQCLAAEHGLGPKCAPDTLEFELIIAEDNGSDRAPILKVQKWYGFFTEHTPPVLLSWRPGRNRDRQRAELYSALQAIGIYHGDLHEENVAFPKGRDASPICIDFGPESCFTGKVRKDTLSTELVNWDRRLKFPSDFETR